MNVNVGPFEYRIRLVHGYVQHEGQACLGLCDNVRQEILLSDVPPEAQRLQVFFHELMHAWWYHFGPDAGDEEAIADLVGIAMTDFLLQARRALTDVSGLVNDDRPLGAEGNSREHQAVATATGPGTSTGLRGTVEAALPSDRLTPAIAFAEAGWSVRIYGPTATVS
jgi:hypothetical protein